MTKYRLAWCSDIHFDFVRPDHRKRFLDSLVLTGANGVLITGDISVSRRIAESLGAIAAMGLPTYFVTGNHDYYTSSFAQTDAVIDSVCRQHPTLVRLGHGEVIPLGEETVLIGHSGWGDGRAGIASRNATRMFDSVLIADLRLENRKLFEKLGELGRASAQYMERVAPAAARRANRIVIATHVPPFAEASRYQGAPGDPAYLPHITNVSMGEALLKIARAFPRKQFLVLCGHTHECCEYRAAENLLVRVARAQYGDPVIEDVLDF